MHLNNLIRLEKTIRNMCNSYRIVHLRACSNATRRYTKIEKENQYLSKDLVPNVILNKKIESIKDWENVRQEILTSNKQISLKTIDSMILGVCIASNNYDLGLAYVNFLKQQKINLGIATCGRYFRLFYLANCGSSVIANEDEMYSLYKTLKEQYKVFDAGTGENIIHALSITRHWRECLNLVEDLKIIGEISRATCSVVAAAHFRNGEVDVGWKLLNECAHTGRFPLNVAYLAYIDACQHSNRPVKEMENLFEFFKLYDIQCDNEVANRIATFYNNLHLSAKHVDLQKSVKCYNCRTLLRKSELTQSDFEELKTAVFKNVIVGSNVFFKTTPSELEAFKQFTANMKNYDVVIDGLNVAYTVGTKQSPQIVSFFVKSVVKHFVDQHKSVLVLGRTHMRTWPKMNWSYITENSDTFLTQTLSHDDPYLLYCALHCGVNTAIVSRDLMRSHLFKLSEVRLKILFNQWLIQNQYRLLYINNQGKAFFKYPLPYTRIAQESNGIWHIPYSTSNEGDGNSNMWVCLTNKK